MTDLLLSVVRWCLHHPQLLFGVVPLQLWGHTWQRAGKIERRWSWPLLFATVLGVAYWRSPKFRTVVHGIFVCLWLYALRLVGWPGRIMWATVTYWVFMVQAVSTIRLRNIAAGVPLNFRSYRMFRTLRQYRRAAQQGVDIAHAEYALVGFLTAGHNGSLRGLVRPAPGKSLVDLQDAAQRGALGASWNNFARVFGLQPLHRVLVRNTGGPEGEGELIGLPTDPLHEEFATPDVVTR